MKKLLFIILLIISQQAISSHYMGGEITWECTSNGNYKFTMKVYRECAGMNYPASIPMKTTVPGFAGITMNRILQTDISPLCNVNFGPHISCATTTQANTGGIEEHIYTSDIAFPNGVPLVGVPPAAGWIFTYEECCRNACTNIIGAGSLCWILRSVMYPYNNTNVSTCFDNSPEFNAHPTSVICTGSPFKFNYDATDNDSDSLAFEWAQAIDCDLTTPISSYTSGYSYQSPLPGLAADSNNVPATINPYTGEVSFTSFTQGAFLIVIKVASYKNGIKVSEIFKEFQMVLLSCGTNLPPIVAPPFIDSLGLFTQFADTVYAGDLVSFPIFGFDYDTLPDGSPQYITMKASGTQFDTSFTNASAGCFNPPCATLSPPPSNSVFSVGSNFNWQTDSAHLNGNLSTTYNFIFEFSDDFCPAPGVNIATVSIIVKEFTPLPPPIIHCTEVLPNGNVKLDWSVRQDSSDYFDSYHIYSSSNRNGPFLPVDSVFNESISTYTHSNAGADQQAIYYQMRTRSGIYENKMSESGNTASTIFLYVDYHSNTTQSKLVWSSPAISTLSSSGFYNILMNCPLGNWTLIDSSTDTMYVDTISLCNELTPYRIEFVDTIGLDPFGQSNLCSSLSNSTSSVGLSEPHLENFILYQNRPNPGDGTTTIEFELPSSGSLVFRVVNLIGEEILIDKSHRNAGAHLFDINTTEFPAGIYFYSLEFEGYKLSKKMVITH